MTCQHHCCVGHLRPCILVLTGHETLLIIDDDVIGEHVPECGLRFKHGTCFSKLGFRVIGRDLDAQLLHLFVRDPGHPAACDQQFAFIVERPDKQV